jgi:hypothetical protein
MLIMQILNKNSFGGPRNSSKSSVVLQEGADVSRRMDFRSASNHQGQKGPGDYLIQLRSEIRRQNTRIKSVLLG